MNTIKTEYWLKSNVCFEPLVWHWYACTDLISPMTAGAFLNKRYLTILQSFLTHPELHQKACQDPKLIGGPYVDLNHDKVPRVSQLKEDIIQNNEVLLALSVAITNLIVRLEKETGFSLETVYQEISDLLLGSVELVYDLYHRANVRIIEPMLYQQYYKEDGQSVLLSEIASDQRPFVLSTPRFPETKDMLIAASFSSKNLDYLAQSRRHPCELSNLYELFNISEQEQIKFAGFFTKTPPKKLHRKHQENTLKIRYFGHACVLIETKESSILIDPFINYADSSNAFNYLDLPDFIDYVLITHGHQDHVNLETLIQLRKQIKTIVVPDNNTGFIVDPSLKLALKQLGFQSVISLKEFEQINLQDGIITGIPFLGEHGDLNIHSKLAYHLKIANKSLFFAVDSNNIDPNLYKKLALQFEPIDIIFIGMECKGAPFSWTYGPVFPQPIPRNNDHSRRLSGSDYIKAWQIITDLKCREVVIYAMGQEPWLKHVMGLQYSDDSIQIREANQLMKRCNESNIKAIMPFGKAEWSIHI